MDLLGIAFFMFLVKVFELCVWLLGIVIKTVAYIVVIPFTLVWEFIKAIYRLIKE